MQEPRLRRVRSVSVRGLFGLYDHEIPLHFSDRVTILHGPNGVGKTTLLNMLAALLGGDLLAFTRIPFSEFGVTLDDGSKLKIAKVAADGLEIRYVPLERPANEERLTPLEDGSLELPWLRPLSYGFWLDIRTGERLSLEEVRDLFGVLPRRRGERLTEAPAWFEQARTSIPIHRIETDRLLRPRAEGGVRERRGYIPTVQAHAQALARRIQEALAEYAKVSQKLDQTFPQRLLKHTHESVDTSDLIARMRALDGRRQQFSALGLLGDQPDLPEPPFITEEEIAPAQVAVMVLYVQDSEEKLSVLREIAARIEILLNIVNMKFVHKRLRVDPEHGLIAETSSGRPLQLTDLSSGEQHELVLLYDLLFEVQPNTLVLIDEPELSLHLLWQKRFLADLTQIVEKVELDVIIATHSPFIVGEREDLLVDLSAAQSS